MWEIAEKYDMTSLKEKAIAKFEEAADHHVWPMHDWVEQPTEEHYKEVREIHRECCAYDKRFCVALFNQAVRRCSSTEVLSTKEENHHWSDFMDECPKFKEHILDLSARKMENDEKLIATLEKKVSETQRSLTNVLENLKTEPDSESEWRVMNRRSGKGENAFLARSEAEIAV